VSGWLHRQIYWNFFIRLVLETYANVVMCCMIQFCHMSMESKGHIIQSVSAIIAMLGLIAFPVYWANEYNT